jgi:hypothetical protein
LKRDIILFSARFLGYKLNKNMITGFGAAENQLITQYLINLVKFILKNPFRSHYMRFPIQPPFIKALEGTLITHSSLCRKGKWRVKYMC